MAYQWKRDGVNIAGATGTTYTVASADLDHTITLAETATNGVGSATANSNTLAALHSAPILLLRATFDLLLFRPVGNVPFAAGSYPADNAALTKEMVGIFSFVNTAWRGPDSSLSLGLRGVKAGGFRDKR